MSVTTAITHNMHQTTHSACGAYCCKSQTMFHKEFSVTANLMCAYGPSRGCMCLQPCHTSVTASKTIGNSTACATVLSRLTTWKRQDYTLLTLVCVICFLRLRSSCGGSREEPKILLNIQKYIIKSRLPWRRRDDWYVFWCFIQPKYNH